MEGLPRICYFCGPPYRSRKGKNAIQIRSIKNVTFLYASDLEKRDIFVFYRSWIDPRLGLVRILIHQRDVCSGTAEAGNSSNAGGADGAQHRSRAQEDETNPRRDNY